MWNTEGLDSHFLVYQSLDSLTGNLIRGQHLPFHMEHNHLCLYPLLDVPATKVGLVAMSKLVLSCSVGLVLPMPPVRRSPGEKASVNSVSVAVVCFLIHFTLTIPFTYYGSGIPLVCNFHKDLWRVMGSVKRSFN